MFTLFFHLIPRVYLLYYTSLLSALDLCTLSCVISRLHATTMSNLFQKMNSDLVYIYKVFTYPLL